MNAEELWSQIQTGIAGQVSAGCRETWFRPLRALTLAQSVLELEVPSEAFRTALAENYLNLLTRTAIEVVGSRIEIRLSCCQSELSNMQGCAQTAQPLPVVRASDIESIPHKPS